MQTDLLLARQKAAEQYPEGIRDSMDRVHPSIIRRGILSGQFDGGRIVQQHMPKEAKR